MTDDFDLSWSRIAGDAFTVAVAAQQAAAATGIQYVPTVLAEMNADASQVADVNPARFGGGTRDGRPLETLMHGAVYKTKSEIGLGVGVQEALAAGGTFLADVVADAIRDANRGAVAASMTVRPTVTGWVRMLNPPSCKFCITLAGKWYRWNDGFQSHPDCDCRHIPASEDVAGDLTTDPYAYFHNLPEQDQNRLFGKADAQAIRDGGDIYRVVNIRSRGLAADAMKNTPGRNRGWQSRRWGTPSKMTIDDIYKAASSRDEAIKLMGENGFITGEQVAGGNLKGNTEFGFGGALGRGGARKGATQAYQKAVASGVRDPLEPATQTAAERRLHSAFLIKQAADRGSNPFGSSPLTKADRLLADQVYEREIAKLTKAPDSVRTLAKLLGII